VILLFIFSVHFNAQDYYDGINTSSPTFISDLQTLIRTGYVKLSYDQYDENMIPGFYAQDLGGGNYRVTCVYTGYNYDYSGTFTWTVLSREHTWCHSWMPSYDSESVDEYSDYHHLFPTHQNNANGRRSNHPLGEVVTIDYQFLDGKLGYDINGDLVYEPRDEQKGDAARALFYMALRYDGISGNDWSFDYLNNTTLASLANPEPPQDLQTLVDWHELDPPDAWEISRNDYIHNIQKNRNPFIDHPEYVYVIDFTDMTKKSQIILPEPTNHVLNFAAVSSSGSQIDLTWTENDGTFVPDAYLIKVSSTDYNSITNPVDGTSQSNDLDLSDGSGAYNISHSNSSYSWSGLSSGTTYYFKIYPYTNSGSDIDYKTNGTIPQDDAETTTNQTVIITEVNDHSTYQYEYVEIYNIGPNSIDLTNWKLYQKNSSQTTTLVDAATNVLEGSLTIGPDSYAIFFRGEATDFTNFKSAYGLGTINAYTNNKTATNSGSPQINGDEVYSLVDNLGNTVDYFGDYEAVSSPQFFVSANFRYERINYPNSGSTSSDWASFASSSSGGSPGSENSSPLPVELVSFTASVNNDEVILLWETATELNNFGFEVERSVVSDQRSENWVMIGFVEGHGNSNSPKEYSFVDNKTSEVLENLSGLNDKLQYRLKQIDYDGQFDYSEIITVETLRTTSLPTTFALEQNYPNPFNPSTIIDYSVPSTEFVTIKVFDVLGNTVSTLINESKEAGKYNVTFDASNLTSGIYFYSINAGGFTQVKKMMLVK